LESYLIDHFVADLASAEVNGKASISVDMNRIGSFKVWHVL